MGSGLSENIWVNLCGFQLAWWLAVVWGSVTWPVLLLLVALHLFFHTKPITEAKLISAAACLGFTLDSLLMYLGVFVFSPESFLPPLWLAILWCCFAATLNQGLSWFSNKLLAAAVIGAIAGPLSYLAGEQLGAVSFGQPLWLTLWLLVVTWALLFPALVLIAVKLASRKTVLRRML